MIDVYAITNGMPITAMISIIPSVFGLDAAL
jgi:hypothetical protein